MYFILCPHPPHFFKSFFLAAASTILILKPNYTVNVFQLFKVAKILQTKEKVFLIKYYKF